MEEQNLLRLTLSRYILSIAWKTVPVASHITTLYIKHHMEEQELLRLTLPHYIIGSSLCS